MSAALLAALVACATAAPSSKPEVAQVAGAPAWVSRGTARVVEAAGPVFYGVGVSVGVRHTAMRRSDAVSKARRELTLDLERFENRLNGSCCAGTAAAGPSDSGTEEQHVEGSLRTRQSLLLEGVEEADHWLANDGTEYALCRLTLARVLQSIDRLREMPAKVKAQVHENAEKAFAEP
jgi:hypothetical protein